MNNVWVVSVLLGIIIVIIGVVVWFGHVTVIHALAGIIVFIGVSVALGGVYGRRVGP